ncbi:hypothetical protein [Nocardioides sp. SYSU D00038]|uniref:AMIN-like domain-containing (lipo)protein n=1 Tax=Nocardioides sp. SYSU D00038 TaxID=2812554 RepID=UPI001966E301|nr:hypothetical protein [Nocardioides sp. SYSU D00038]
MTTRVRRTTTVLLSAIAALPLLAGCGTDDRASPARPASPASPDGPASPEGPLAPRPTTAATASAWGTERQTSSPHGGSELVLVDVRVTQVADVDRIVLQFRGTATPGWVVGYVDEAVVDGSGEVVDLGGAMVLDVYASGTTWPAPDHDRGPRRLTPHHGGVVTAVHVAGTFEGTTQVLAGIDGGRVPFRVRALTSPSRLVVEVAKRDG